MQSSDLPTPPTNPVADPPTDEVTLNGHDARDVPAAASASDPAPEAAPVAETATTETPAATPPAKAATPPAKPAPVKAKATPPPAKPATSKAPLLIGAVVLLALATTGVFLIAPQEKSATPTAQPSAAPSSAAAATPTPAASNTAAASSDLAAIKVTGTDKPALTAPIPFAVKKTTTRVLKPGTGPAVASGQRVTIEYLGVNGTNGKTFDTSFDRTDTTSFIVGDANLIKGMNVGLTGAKVGSRVLLAIPAADGYGSNGAPDAGIGPADTLLFLIDIKSAATPPTPLKRATGTAVAPKAGLPTVTLDSATGKPTLTVPKATAPTSLVVQPLINGKGATVAKGQTITVHYTGVIWGSGKEFDSSWTKNQPASFAIGTGNVIPGWDKGLVGKKVGSQVLLVIPPADGYGATGAPDAGISGTDTLVFVVDILATS